MPVSDRKATITKCQDYSRLLLKNSNMETYYIRNKNFSTPIITILKCTRQRTKTYLHKMSGRDTIVSVCQRWDAVHPDMIYRLSSKADRQILLTSSVCIIRFRERKFRTVQFAVFRVVARVNALSALNVPNNICECVQNAGVTRSTWTLVWHDGEARRNICGRAECEVRSRRQACHEPGIALRRTRVVGERDSKHIKTQRQQNGGQQHVTL